MESLANSPEVISSNKKGPMKGGKSFNDLENDFPLRISSDVSIKDMEGILAIWQNKRGFLESKIIVSADGKAPEPSLVKNVFP